MTLNDFLALFGDQRGTTNLVIICAGVVTENVRVEIVDKTIELHIDEDDHEANPVHSDTAYD